MAKSKKTFKRRTNPHASSFRSKKYWKSPINQFRPCGTGNNCTWYAWGRFCEIWAELGGHPHWVGNWGNAVTFWNNAKRFGFKRGLEPQLGAIICWGYGSYNGGPGHVAVVESMHTNSSGKVTKITVSQGGCSSGDMADMTLTRGNGKQGHAAWHWSYSNPYFKGFIYNPKLAGGSYGGGSDDEEEETIDMKERIKTLYSSDNYKYVKQEEEQEETEDSRVTQARENFKSALTSLSSITTNEDISKLAVSDEKMKAYTKNITERAIRKAIIPNANLYVATNLVEAPVVEVGFNGYFIGSVQGNVDEYPNYIDSMQVSKVNGEINQYTINIVYQIRAGEDPNLIDKLLSRVRYDKIQITYGDANSGRYYSDTEAMITNVTMNRDYAGSKITYAISATSANNLVTTHTMNFSAVTAKPSTVINRLLYNSGETSRLLLNAFPGMKNRTSASSLIPTNDAELSIEPQTNVDPISYINFLVGSMSNMVESQSNLRNSSYYITYSDDEEGLFGGAYFKITEITKHDSRSRVKNCFEVNVGYPGDECVMVFKINNDSAWSLLYKNKSIAPEYVYSVLNDGTITQQESRNLTSASNIQSEINKNWWSDMVNFPITAQLTLRGLLRRSLLMEHIYVNVYFYGQKHYTSGLYVITAQTDKLSGSGFRTVLDLTRVGNE